jgi:hypothetical protein
MLAELHRLFPKNLAMQSLGSFDHARKRDRYIRLCKMPGNDVLQVHRYLDLGASLDVCRGPADVLAADAVGELLASGVRKPVLLAESGAVEPSHTGPFKLYQKDRAGIILHDVLFAPFFAGAAGPGHCWHWEVYVDRLDLWHHFGRFADVVRDIDPPAETFRPERLSHTRLRILALKGRKTFLAWCRDTENNWRSELEKGEPPGVLENLTLDPDLEPGWIQGCTVSVYDPWKGSWTGSSLDDGRLQLPPFSRSVVVKIVRAGGDLTSPK